MDNLKAKLKNNWPVWAYWTGIALVAVSVLFLVLIFYPVVREEIKYQFSAKGNNVVVETTSQAGENKLADKNVIVPVDTDFGIVIPKISANTKVIADVDWKDSQKYQRSLTQGVAQAKGTANPGEEGNLFIFAHSGADFLEANRYNAVFYLLDKMEQGDEIDIFFQGQKYTYVVTDRKTINAEEIKYMDATPGQKTLTLMTCWPAGTTLKRMVVMAIEK
jgi:sortase A